MTMAIVAIFAGMALAGCTTNNGQTTTTTPGGTTSTSTTTTGTTTPTPDPDAQAKADLKKCADDAAAKATVPTFSTPAAVTAKGPTFSGGAGSGAPNKGTYTILSIGEAESLDTAYDYESAGGQITGNIYQGLYGYDGGDPSALVPVLAASMPGYNDDKTVMQIKLRQNVPFHTGGTMTAEDVKFSLDRVVIHNDPDSPAWIYTTGLLCANEYAHIDVSKVTQEDRDNYLRAKAVEVVDDNTVIIRLAFADPSFLYRLAYNAASVVSKDAFCANKPEGAGADCFAPLGQTRHPWADDHEAGTGPFMLERWTKGQEIVLKRFDSYWGDKPTLERVIVRKVDDFNTRLTALKAGEADDVYIPVDHDADVMPGGTPLPGIEIIERPSWAVSFIGYNQHFCGGASSPTYQQCLADNADAAPKGSDGQVDPDFFADIHMRKAWSYAFDYDTYLNDIVKGHGKLLNGVLPEGIFGYNAAATSPKQDLAKAREELAASKHADGFSVVIYYNQGNTVREKTAQLLAENLMDLGDNINVEAKGLDWSTAYLPKQRAQAIAVFYLGWLPDYAYPDNYAVTFAHSTDGIYAKRIGYSNPALDAKMDALLRETDEAKLRTGWGEVQQQLNDDFAFMWLAQATNFHVQRDWVDGYYYNPMHSGAPQAGDFSTLSKA